MICTHPSWTHPSWPPPTPPGRGSVFRNIPYGKAGRWEDPRPAFWQGALDASRSRVSCMQDAGDSNTKAVEDCLNLDIFTPAAAGQRPVLLWFYGGAFVAGAAAGLSAEAAWPLVAEQDCVLVVPDTRVGAFGYLGSERARRNSTGNWGTLDQLLALAWVSDNIAYFGGDPGRITIGGWSSGAAAASVLLSSLGESQPLQGAIMSSGGFTDWAAFGMKTAEENYDALLKAVGCQASPECQREGPACSCLLTVPAESLVAAGDGISWAPIIDGILVKLSPMDALRAGKVKSVPIILGSCLEEGMAALPSDATPADFKSWVKGIVPESPPPRGLRPVHGCCRGPRPRWRAPRPLARVLGHAAGCGRPRHDLRGAEGGGGMAATSLPVRLGDRAGSLARTPPASAPASRTRPTSASSSRRSCRRPGCRRPGRYSRRSGPFCTGATLSWPRGQWAKARG
ncbi:unnamed protein product [Prorocentrum cordatum]|uniref:Carboxylic ester hydrolase n=1 Tax=Prorocentrum cordatum TaxID=2364126 RepID=A0ABN9VMD8_9DINO|nr:unnamed protein product [Polarella glacialis]